MISNQPKLSEVYYWMDRDSKSNDDMDRYLLKEEDYRNDLLRHMGETAASIIHEVRNPLQTVKAFMQVLSRIYKDDQTMNGYSDVVISELDRADNLLSDFLRFSRSKQDKFEIVNMVDICQDTVLLIRSHALLKGISIVDNYPPVLPLISVDVASIRQVLLNLLTNAIDACESGGIISIAVEKNHDELHVMVKDNGQGMDVEQMHKIFNSFYTTKEKGTGLGLFISKSIARNHGGDILVGSSPGCGSCFILSLPLKKQ
ncbi:MAG: ATP-binding protein [Clostridiales bacterium]